MKIITVSLLICFLLAFATAQSSNIKLDVFSGSNNWWLAVAVRNAGVDTRSVQIKQAGSSSWQSADFQQGWGYFTLSSNDRLRFPVSVLLTSANGETIPIENVIASTSVGTVETNARYTNAGTSTATSAPSSTATGAPSSRPSSAATSRPAATLNPAKTAKPSKAPTAASTSKATTSPTGSATSKPATAAPTKTAATSRPATAAPTTRAATSRPATTAPTTRATTPASSGGCSGPIKLMVPLYSYPGAAWDVVAASGRTVPTVAIINPNSGPGNGPDSTFTRYMTKLNDAGVEMVGYVHTLWGARDINTVKREIDVYASQFPHVVGIFLDEGAATADKLPYFQELYSYIMSMPGWKYDIINPGTTPVQGYLNAATQIVSFEDSSSKFAASSNPSFASCSNKDKFAVITYGASTSGMQSAVNTAKSKGYYGWVYVTDGAGGCCTYNSLASYYGSMATYIASVN